MSYTKNFSVTKLRIQEQIRVLLIFEEQSTIEYKHFASVQNSLLGFVYKVVQCQHLGKG